VSRRASQRRLRSPTVATAVPGRGRRLAAAALFAAVALYVFPYYPILSNPNEDVRLYMTAALVDEGTYEISAIRRRWGWTNDAACVDTGDDGSLVPCEGPMRQHTPEGDGRRYFSVKAPLASWLGVPGYALYRWVKGDAEPELVEALWWTRVSASVLPMLFFFYFFHGFLGRLTRSPIIRDAVYVATALGSVLLGYALLFVSHSQSAATAFGAFMILAAARRTPARRPGHGLAFLAGLLAASTTALEYPCVLVTALLCLQSLFALHWSRWIAFGLGALLPTLMVMHFQDAAFGSALSPGHLFVENPAFRTIHEGGFFGMGELQSAAAWKLLFHPRLGLFALTPLFAFAFLGVVPAFRRPGQRLEAAVGTAIVVAMYLAVIFLANWDGGWVIGPRYLMVIFPFVACGAAIGLDSIASDSARARRVAHALALGTAAASLVLSGFLSLYYPHLPPELDWPLAHLFGLLVAHDFAPYTALHPLDVHGSASMVPVALVFTLALLWASHRQLRSLALALPVAAALIAAHVLPAGAPEPAERAAVGFVTEHWSPAGHDLAAQLDRAGDPASLHRRVDVLREEGRDAEAARLERRLQGPR